MLNFDPLFRFLEYLMSVPIEKWLAMITLLALVIVLIAIRRLIPRYDDQHHDRGTKSLERRK